MTESSSKQTSFYFCATLNTVEAFVHPRAELMGGWMDDSAHFSGRNQARQRRRVQPFFYETAIPLMRGAEGIVQMLPGASRADSPREFNFVMVWKDLVALKAFVGEAYQSRHTDPAEAELVESRTIKHYDLVED